MAKRKKSKVQQKPRKKSRNALYIVSGSVLLVLLGLAVHRYFTDATAENATVIMTDVSLQAGSGKLAFEKHCGECHGINAAGTDKGPTLIHRIYEPSHHADFAFVRAVRFGVRQHHWRFGNMPPQPEVTRAEMEVIISYVRELQRANGIF